MSGDKVVAIHQPNFFPWLGYFNKVASADVFILMDNVQFSKKGGNWANRVQLMINGAARWVTVPVVRGYSGVRPIKDIQINNATAWRNDLMKTVQVSYGRAPHFEAMKPVVAKLVYETTDNLAQYNASAIRALSSLLGLNTSALVLGSDLEVAGHGTDLLISMVKAVEGTAYLAGGGADGYQEDEKFEEAGIELIAQDFQHPVYPQVNTPEFVPGLSVLDALMNCGPQAAGLIQS